MDVSRLDDRSGGFLTSLSFAAPQIGIAAGTENNAKRTVDGGRDWTEVPGPDGSINILSIELLPNGNLLCIHDLGKLSVLKSGSEWQTILNHTFGNQNEYFKSMAIIDDQKIFLGSDKGALISTQDGGTTWSDTVLDEGVSLLDIDFSTSQFGCIYGNEIMYWTYNAVASWHSEDLSQREELWILSQSTGINNRIAPVDPFTLWVAGPNDAMLKFERSLNLIAPQEEVITGHSFTLNAASYHAEGECEILGSLDGADWTVLAQATAAETFAITPLPLNEPGQWEIKIRSVVQSHAQIPGIGRYSFHGSRISDEVCTE